MSAMQTHPPPTFNTNILIHVQNLLRGNVKKKRKILKDIVLIGGRKVTPTSKNWKEKIFWQKLEREGGHTAYCQK